MLRWLGLFVISLSVGATTFQIQGVNDQLKAADGVMIGHFLRSKGIQLENGMIATQMIFQMKKEYGLQSDLFGMDEVIIHFPGGKVGNLRSEIQGIPKFVPGEKAALMIKSVDNRYWGLNLGMGTYKVVNYGKEVMLINSVFPDDPKMGQLRLDDFEKRIKLVKGSNLKTVMAPQYPTEMDARAEVQRLPASGEGDFTEGKNRSVASHPDQGHNEDDQRNINTYWLVALLAFLGGAFKLARSKNAK